MDFGNQNKSDSPQTNAILLIVGVTVLCAIGGFIISTGTPLLFPPQASEEAKQVDTLFRVLLGISGGLFIFVQGLLLYSVVRYRVRPDDMRDGPTIHGNVTLELIWTAIPAIIVFALAIYSYTIWADIRAPKDNELVVHATGQRFAWTFEHELPSQIYAGLEAEQQARVDDAKVAPSPVLHLYSGRPVNMVMNTQDVIHSFWVPAMRMKQDLIPGRTTEIRFTPTLVDGQDMETVLVNGVELQAQRYRINCAELCGGGHGQMFTYVNLYATEEDYLAAMNALWADIINPPADPIERGRQILASGAYPCSGCHTLQAEGIDWSGVTGPALNGVGDRAPRRIAGIGPEEYLHRSIYHPQEFFVPGYSGVIMPQFQPDNPDGNNYMPTTDNYYIVSFLCAQTESGESNCDQETLLNLINEAYPDHPVQLEQADAAAEATPEAESTAQAESTPEVTPVVETTPES
jgi:cytochrome c oxidase subunit 2